MSHQLLLYSRTECCLCEEMKAVIDEVAARIPLTLREVDIDNSAELQKEYGQEVPVLFIDGRKAFKYQVTAKELTRRLKRRDSGA